MRSYYKVTTKIGESIWQ